MAVHLARLLSEARPKLLAAALAFERCAAWPTCFLTGYFTAVHAVKERGA